jgi:hypothetical protein
MEQTPSHDRVETHKCPIHNKETYEFQKRKKPPDPGALRAPAITMDLLPPRDQHHNNREITVLRAANCTGEYFGIGPTCRCQEMLRFFLQSPPPTGGVGGVGGAGGGWEWFMFVDDDVYVRPYALHSFLAAVQAKLRRHQHSSQQHLPLPVVLMTGKDKAQTRGFKFSTAWHDRRNSTNQWEEDVAKGNKLDWYLLYSLFCSALLSSDSLKLRCFFVSSYLTSRPADISALKSMSPSK